MEVGAFKGFVGRTVEDFREGGAQPHTIAGVRRLLETLRVDLKVRSLRELERGDIFERLDALNAAKGFAQSTRWTAQATLRSIIKRGRTRGCLRSMPELPVLPDPRSPKWKQRFPRSERTLPPPPAQISRLDQYLARNGHTWQGGRLRAFVPVISSAGVPLVAALRLRRTDFDLANESVVFRKRSNTAPLRRRITRELVAILSAWFPRVACEWAFPGVTQEGPWYECSSKYTDNPRRALRDACEAAGCGRITYAQLLRNYSENSLVTVPGIVTKAALQPTVVLDGPDNPVFVMGKDWDTLPRGQYDVLKALMDAGPDGIEADVIEKVSKRGAARKLARALGERPAFRGLIGLPQRGNPASRGRYRILKWWID